MIKQVTKPMLNIKSFRAAGSVLVAFELIHMIRRGQFIIDGAKTMSFAYQFYAGRNGLSILSGSVLL